MEKFEKIMKKWPVQLVVLEQVLEQIIRNKIQFL